MMMTVAWARAAWMSATSTREGWGGGGSKFPARVSRPDSQLAVVNQYPGPRSIVVLDNASIHRSRAFVDALALRGVKVLFTPPYAWDTTPLDNGAFGKVAQYFQAKSMAAESTGLTTRLTAALRWSVTRADARRCVHQCGYQFS